MLDSSVSVTIMRGLPGSGKTTWARKNISPVLLGVRSHSYTQVFSADDFFLNKDGVYVFDKTRIGEAHADCLRRFANWLVTKSEKHQAVIDNTNTTLLELAPYVRLCEAFQCKFEIVYLYCELPLAAARNLHGVPPSALLQMQANLLTEVVPPYWNQRVIL